MLVDEQHNSIGKDGRQLRETGIASRGRHVRRHAAAGERLEPEQQPRWIVRDFEIEASIGRKRERRSGALGFMSIDWTLRDENEQRNGQSP